MKMLVVSAHGPSRRLVRHLTDPTKCTFLPEAESAERALEILAEAEEECNAVWIDSYHLGMSPNELARQIRDRFPGMLLVLWTTTKDANPQYFNLAVSKPTDMTAMNEAILNLMVMHGG